ncbi:unnamed protein product, partial [Rangifer tarandus platyrhynchus]
MEKRNMSHSGEPQRSLSGTEIRSLQQSTGTGVWYRGCYSGLPASDLELELGSLGSSGQSRQTKLTSSVQSTRQYRSGEKKT